MKYIISTLLVLSFLWVIQPKKNLYLLYQKSSHIDTSYKTHEQKAFFAYEMYYNNKLEQRLFLFENKISERDTIALDELKKLNLKDYSWLEKNFISYYHFRNDPSPRINSSGKTRYYKLNKFYHNIYVVKIDSSANRAILYKVHQDYLSDYEGFDIPLKDTTISN